MRAVAFDYTLWGVDEVTDLAVKADVDLASQSVVLRSVTIAATGEPYDIANDNETRRCLESDAVLVAEDDRDREEWG